jgi:hypothetical protein
MKLKRALCFLAVLLAATAISSAATAEINATVQGCTPCIGLGSMAPGSVVTPDSPTVQLTLGPGTYIITDAAATGTYSAWNYQYGGGGSQNNGNWVWSFGIANDATGVVLLEDYVGTAPGTLATFLSQTAAAGATGIQIYGGSAGNTLLSGETDLALFSDTLTLATTTTLDLFVTDAYVSDNLGGIALNVTQQEEGAPEPAIPLLIGTGLAAMAIYRRKRQSRVG